MAKELTDDELNLRRKARRRLIGAIALTLAVVVILPMVLESQPKPTGQDIDLRIPSPEKAGEFVTNVAISEVPVALPVSAVVVASAVAAVSEPAATSAVVSVAVPKAAEPAESKPAESKSAESKSAESKSAVQAAPAPAAGSAKKEDKAVTYAAQVGAYSNPNTAKQELAKLKDWGFKAYTEKAGNKIRVRVGPYEERVKAEKVIKLLEKHGLHPSIVSIK
ncbi:MAG: SPOR domain-containing protein [Gallionella sp.]|jgi:DedD protein|nr:SPOR domain-containing protein [Gallionella sp.]MCK9353597.1 SPOR domain-containing protein [Gallionella sp.]